MEKLKVIFLGTGEFGVETLKKLTGREDFEVPFIITGQDKKAGRGLKAKFSPVKEAALYFLENKLIVHQPRKIAELEQKITQEKPDFLLVVSYGEIIPKRILEIPRFGSINIHASKLPKYRGASPIQEALLHGDTMSGITWILMNEKMDQGDILDQTKVSIQTDDTYETLSQRLASLAAKETGRVLVEFSRGKKPIPQNNKEATVCRKIKKEDGAIDLKLESAHDIVNKIRAFTPWPSCHLMLNGKRIKIIQARVGEQKMSSGEMLMESQKTLVIGTKKGALIPLVVQPESKRQMSIEEFLRGNKP